MHQALRHSRLVVVDYPLTAFLEALVANVPAVGFWDPQRWELRDDAEPYFGALREVGIVWESPEAAARRVAHVYPDVQRWWGNGDLQAARRRFVERYALTSERWGDRWVQVLKEQAARAPGGCSSAF